MGIMVGVQEIGPILGFRDTRGCLLIGLCEETKPTNLPDDGPKLELRGNTQQSNFVECPDFSSKVYA